MMITDNTGSKIILRKRYFCPSGPQCYNSASSSCPEVSPNDLGHFLTPILFLPYWGKCLTIFHPILWHARQQVQVVTISHFISRPISSPKLAVKRKLHDLIKGSRAWTTFNLISSLIFSVGSWLCKDSTRTKSSLGLDVNTGYELQTKNKKPQHYNLEDTSKSNGCKYKTPTSDPEKLISSPFQNLLAQVYSSYTVNIHMPHKNLLHL